MSFHALTAAGVSSVALVSVNAVTPYACSTGVVLSLPVRAQADAVLLLARATADAELLCVRQHLGPGPAVLGERDVSCLQLVLVVEDDRGVGLERHAVRIADGHATGRAGRRDVGRLERRVPVAHRIGGAGGEDRLQVGSEVVDLEGRREDVIGLVDVGLIAGRLLGLQQRDVGAGVVRHVGDGDMHAGVERLPRLENGVQRRVVERVERDRQVAAEGRVLDRRVGAGCV